MDNTEIIIRLLRIADLHPCALKHFNRYQETNRVRYEDNGQHFYKDEHFVECWDEQKKEQVIQSLRQCMEKGGIVAGAFTEGAIIGFANVDNKAFGKNKEYLELPYIHISYEYRYRGIGRQLFRLCCEKAKELGAWKLYIAAHPAEETQNFYGAMGCVPAAEVNKEIYEKEPLDIQLEVEI